MQVKMGCLERVTRLLGFIYDKTELRLIYVLLNELII